MGRAPRAAAFDRRAVVRVAVTAALALVGVVAPTAATAAPSDVQPGNLVSNGDAETGTTDGWSGAIAVERHDDPEYASAVLVDGTLFPGGTFLFTGTGSSSSATQQISLAPSAAAIDNGRVTAHLSAFLGGWYSQPDQPELTYDFRDGGGQSLAVRTLGPQTPGDRGGRLGFLPYSDSITVPIGTRSVLLTFSSSQITGVNDAYADNIALFLDVPSPAATPDVVSTENSSSIDVRALENDVPGDGAALDPSSLRLVDGGALVTELTTGAGRYDVDTGTGVISFRADPSFLGTAPAVTYHVSDTSGQSTRSTLTVNVTQSPDATTSSIAASEPTILADGTTSSVLTVVLRDAAGNPLRVGGDTVTVASSAGSVGPTVDHGDGTYSAALTSSTAPETARVSFSVNGVASPNQTAVVFVGPVASVDEDPAPPAVQTPKVLAATGGAPIGPVLLGGALLLCLGLALTLGHRLPRRRERLDTLR